jgi:hypothetical protein
MGSSTLLWRLNQCGDGGDRGGPLARDLVNLAMLQRGKKGERMLRSCRAFIGRSRGSIWCLNLLGIILGRHSLAAEVTRGDLTRGRRRLRVLTGGPQLSASVRERAVLFWISLGGPWAASAAGPKGVPRGPFLFFFVFPFSFSIFLINS